MIEWSDNSFDNFLLLMVGITFNNISHFHNEIMFTCKICTFVITYFSSMLHVRYLGTKSLLYGLPESQITKLKRIRNSAARVVTLSQKCDHVTPILRELHWPLSSIVLCINFYFLNQQILAYLQQFNITKSESICHLRLNNNQFYKWQFNLAVWMS